MRIPKKKRIPSKTLKAFICLIFGYFISISGSFYEILPEVLLQSKCLCPQNSCVEIESAA